MYGTVRWHESEGTTEYGSETTSQAAAPGSTSAFAMPIGSIIDIEDIV
jgi:hypothetical protein